MSQDSDSGLMAGISLKGLSQSHCLPPESPLAGFLQRRGKAETVASSSRGSFVWSSLTSSQAAPPALPRCLAAEVLGFRATKVGKA